MSRHDVVLYGPNGHPIRVQLSGGDPWALIAPAVAAALIIATAGIGVAIGAGVVGWSYWWLLLPGIPAGLMSAAACLTLLFPRP